MANESGGGIGIIGVIIGAVIVIAVAFFLLRGDAGDADGPDVKIETPAPSAPATPAAPANP